MHECMGPEQFFNCMHNSQIVGPPAVSLLFFLLCLGRPNICEPTSWQERYARSPKYLTYLFVLIPSESTTTAQHLTHQQG